MEFLRQNVVNEFNNVLQAGVSDLNESDARMLEYLDGKKVSRLELAKMFFKEASFSVKIILVALEAGILNVDLAKEANQELYSTFTNHKPVQSAYYKNL